MATESHASTTGPVLEEILQQADIERGPITTDGVYARVVNGRTLYVNRAKAHPVLPEDPFLARVVAVAASSLQRCTETWLVSE